MHRLLFSALWLLRNSAVLKTPISWPGIQPVCKMHLRYPTIWALAALLLLAGWDVTPSLAQQVGQAAVIKNEVVRVDAGSRRISVGDGVVRDETIRTGADSAARFVMADSTNLSLGPGSTIKLDRTVFSGERSFRDIAVRAASGSVRFVTGNSDKTAYTILTPLASIGVRGTTLDILSDRTRSVVVLQQGASRVCTRRTATNPTIQCVELLQPGDTAIVTASNGQLGIQKTNNPPWTFAANCAAASGLCATTQYADAGPLGSGDATGALCGQ